MSLYCSPSSLTGGVSYIFHFSPFSRDFVVSHSSLICIFLMTNDIEHFSYILSIWISFMPIFFLLTCLSFYWLVRIHFILDISPLSSFENIFSHSVFWLFALLIFFAGGKIFNLIISIIDQFLFGWCCLCSI